MVRQKILTFPRCFVPFRSGHGVVTRRTHEELMNSLYDAPTAGHLGLESTLKKLKEKYHADALTPYVGPMHIIEHTRRRGRPAKSQTGCSRDLEGEDIAIDNSRRARDAKGTASNTASPSRLHTHPARSIVPKSEFGTKAVALTR
jgi:hypothetical protein